MNGNPGNPGASPRSTLLIGHGEFGLEALRRLLASTALRGVLQWHHTTAGSGKRSLRNLGLIHVRDRWHAEDDSGRLGLGDEDGGALELLLDVYRQIEWVEPDEARVADLAEQIARSLLTMSDAPADGRALPAGLDVVLLARPHEAGLIGHFDRLMLSVMERLQRFTFLERGVQGAEVLNYVAIYDFESYWKRDAEGRETRRSLHRSVLAWQGRRQRNDPTYSRIYLADEGSRDGLKKASERIEEASLFLELLLFEGQRGGGLQRLAQSAGAHEAPLGTYGVRMLERGSGLLKRLAAARFGMDWLTYLAEPEGRRDEAESKHLEEALERFKPKNIQPSLGKGDALGDLDVEFQDLEQAVAGLALEDPGWVERVREKWRRGSGAMEDVILYWGKNHLRNLKIDEGLGQTHRELLSAIDQDLLDQRDPVPLGELLNRIEDTSRNLRETVPDEPAPSGRPENAFRRLRELHRRFLQHARDLLSPEDFGARFWPLLSATLAFCLAPWLITELEYLLALLPPPAPTAFWQPKFMQVVEWMSHPLLFPLLFWFLLWAMGRLMFQKRVRSRVERSRKLYDDPEQGRMIGRWRNETRPGGDLRAALETELDRQAHALELNLRAEMQRELRRVADRLQSRKQEMSWMSRQLFLFLKAHGVTAERLSSEESIGRAAGRIRDTIARQKDLRAVLESFPSVEANFRTAQVELQPFDHWQEKYSGRFLHPLHFVDWLSERFTDPIEEEEAQSIRGEEMERQKRAFMEFLGRWGRMGLAFTWPAQEGVPTPRSYCLMPRVWERIPNVFDVLCDQGVQQSDVLFHSESGRGYLLRLQQGVHANSLLGAGE